jgi:hypothetical protein
MAPSSRNPQRHSSELFISPAKTFHLSFPEMRRAETSALVKTQQFMMCMNEIADRRKRFSPR